jgi:hypothetical protein
VLNAISEIVELHDLANLTDVKSRVPRPNPRRREQLVEDVRQRGIQRTRLLGLTLTLLQLVAGAGEGRRRMSGHSRLRARLHRNVIQDHRRHGAGLRPVERRGRTVEKPAGEQERAELQLVHRGRPYSETITVSTRSRCGYGAEPTPRSELARELARPRL